MSRFSTICLLFIFAVGLPITSWAQDDDDDERMPTYTAWQVTSFDEAGEVEEPLDPDAPANFVVVMELEDGSLLFVWAGPDIIYEPQDDGTYSGSVLVPNPSYTFTATLEIIDEDTMMSHSVTETERFTIESSYQYDRTDAEAAVFTELERTIVEYTQLSTCLGFETEPGRAWVTSDLLVPIQIGESSLIWNQHLFEGGGGSYVNERTQDFNQLDNVIVQTFTGTEEGFDFNYHATVDGRDDCETIYDSSYVPFDEDFEVLFERAEAEAEALSEDD